MRSVSFKLALFAMLLSGRILAIAQPAHQINPQNGIKWPVCSPGTSVYSIVSNACIAIGTAANPAGASGDFQINTGGIFGFYTPAQALSHILALPLAGGTLTGPLIGTDGTLDTLTVKTNAVYITSLLRTRPSLGGDGNLIPLGNDLWANVKGAADLIGQNERVTVNASTSVAPGLHTVTIDQDPANVFYLGATLTIDRFTANEESIAIGWTYASSSSISATFAKSHTAPYVIDQWGAIDSKGHLWRFWDPDTGTELYETNVERSGGNEAFNTTRGGKFLHRIDPANNQVQDFGDLVNGHVHILSNGLTGSCANDQWWDNFTDQNIRLYLECSTGILHLFGGLYQDTNEILPATLNGHHGNGVKVQFSDNTGVTDHYAAFDSNGNIKDSGTGPANMLTRTADYTAVGSGFIQMDCAAPCTLTLPASPATGFSVAVMAKGAGTVTVDPNGLGYDGATTLGYPQTAFIAFDGVGYHSNVPASVVTGAPTVGQAACIKAAGPPVVLGYCSSVVGAGGACTCN
jgi:hypothetical protein